MLAQEQTTFREQLGILEKTGKRHWIYPKKTKGFYTTARKIFAFVLLSAFFVLPFIKVDGHRLFLLNIFDRKFIIFGKAFFPQDFFLLALLLVSFVVFVALFTVVYGRLFCGWACPQTIFMEMIFRQVEYWIEGDASAQRKLAESSWTKEKIFKKTLKHTIFLVISFVFINIFAAYLVGIERVKELYTSSFVENWVAWVFILLFTGIFYAVFAFIREIVCIVICPYGRMQGVLLDSNSIVVAYDFIRGEPRGKIKKGDNIPKGDCIDCKLCVHVCPTGIDIRNGTQLECINCTACIDACNEVMDKIRKPRGLIRYDSMNGIRTGKKFQITGRMIGYSVVLLVLLGVMTAALMLRKDVQINIMRTPGILYQEIGKNKDTVANLYNATLVNKTFRKQKVYLKLAKGQVGKIQWVATNQELILQPQEVLKVTFFIQIPKKAVTTSTMKVHLNAFNEKEQLLYSTTTSFLAPAE